MQTVDIQKEFVPGTVPALLFTLDKPVMGLGLAHWHWRWQYHRTIVVAGNTKNHSNSIWSWKRRISE